MSLLDELLAPFADALPRPTPAKAANPAKAEHPCGLEPHSGPCEGLRISAKAPPDSQLFAGVRRPVNTAQAQYPYGSSQDSQDSQGLPGTKASDADLTGWNVTLAPNLPAATAAKFKAASEALDRQIAEAAAVSWRNIERGEGDASDPDRWCWPHSPVMNTGEIELFEARVALFRRRGLSADLAEAMADRMVHRNREGDDRRTCLECAHLSGRRCVAWRAAGIDDPDVSDLRTKPQRCDGFRGAGYD